MEVKQPNKKFRSKSPERYQKGDKNPESKAKSKKSTEKWKEIH